MRPDDPQHPDNQLSRNIEKPSGFHMSYDAGQAAHPALSPVQFYWSQSGRHHQIDAYSGGNQAERDKRKKALAQKKPAAPAPEPEPAPELESDPEPEEEEEPERQLRSRVWIPDVVVRGTLGSSAPGPSWNRELA